MKKRLQASALLTCAMVTSSVQAKITASVAVANQYVFRGLALSNGSPVVAGALDYEHQSGLYAGIWSGSGDDSLGTEVNYYLGYRGSLRGFSYGVDYLNYYYPQSKGSTMPIIDFNDYAEVTLSVAYLGIGLSVSAPTRDEVAGDYRYYLLSYRYETFSLVLGVNDHESRVSRYSHVDLAYQFHQHLSFGISQVIDQGKGAAMPNAALFLITLRFPIEL